MTAAPTMGEIRKRAEPRTYPVHVLEDCSTALLLFAAGFYGQQDGYHVASYGLRATCVDLDGEKLAAMRNVYPRDWTYEQNDVYSWVEGATRKWDVVSVDCPTDGFQTCASLLPAFCNLATKAVILGTGGNVALAIPGGWKLSGMVFRSNTVRGGVWWAVVEAE